MTKPAAASSRAPEFFQRLMDLTMQTLHDAGMAPEPAAELALEIVARVGAEFGAQQIYVPTGTWNGRTLPWWMLADRDRQAMSAYTGRNRREVCATYGISEQRFYQLLAIARSRRAPITPAPAAAAR